MKTRRACLFVFLLFCLPLFLAAPLRAQSDDTSWSVAALDQILAGVQPGQKLVAIGDMQILVSKLTQWRNQLAGVPSQQSAFDGVAATWPGGNIYYNFTTTGPNAVPANYQKAFLDAAGEWATFANLHFIPQTTQTNYVTIEVLAGLEGGESSVGMVGNQQFLSISPDAWNRGTICHEIGHLLGLVHEHQRSDRTNYVTILTNNIDSNALANFVLLLNSRNESAYDFLSVMHYARNYLSTNGQDTIEPLPAYTNFINLMGVPGPVVLSAGDRAGMAAVYGAAPATSSMVTNTQNSGAGSLLAALYYAYDHPGTHITFNIPTNDPGYTNGVFTIQPSDQLPWVVNSTLLDGASQPTNAGSNPNGPLIQINGALATASTFQPNGLLLGGTNCTVRSLVINGFVGSGILLTGSNSTGNTVSGCYFSTDPSGTNSVSSSLPGVTIAAGAHGNTIGGTNAAARNIISGSIIQGLVIRDAGTQSNVVEGNYVGLNAAGTASLANGFSGIEIFNGAQNNLIGGTTAAARNIISGNYTQGVLISDTGTTSNTIAGNYIGLNPSGVSAIPNGYGNPFAQAGVFIGGGAQSNLIGGTLAGAGNVLSGNSDQGVAISNVFSTGNLIQGNLVGLDPTGTVAIPNAVGINLFGGAQSNIIGGIAPGAGNVISGNAFQGVSLQDAGTMGNLVQGNWIGLNAAGTAAIPNQGAGVGIYAPVQSNIIGGTVSGARNVVSGNNAQGVAVGYAGGTGNVIEGNYIGLNPTGASAIPNGGAGVNIYGGAAGSIIGGTAPGAGNVISGNSMQGIFFQDDGTTGNFVLGNLVGLNAAGNAAVSNAYSGVQVGYGAYGNTIGGIGGRNFISGNANNGVLIDYGAFDNIVQGNTIGLDISNHAVVPNLFGGVTMYGGTQSNLVGGTVPGAANLIVGNIGGGIELYDAATSNNVLRGNSVYGNAPGVTPPLGININTSANNSDAESPPGLASASVTTNTSISGTLSSLANTTFHLDFYASPPPANQAQAKTWLGSQDVATGAGGTVSFTKTVASPVPIGEAITAIATDPFGNTSSLSVAVTVTGTDSVGDGIPDAWRHAHFAGTGTTTNSTNCATCDPDHDGLNNRQEFLAGTDPNNAASKLLINSISDNGTDITVSFQSAPGIVYRVDYRDDLPGSDWQLFVDQILGTGGVIQLTDPGVATLPKRYYRLDVLP